MFLLVAQVFVDIRFPVTDRDNVGQGAAKPGGKCFGGLLPFVALFLLIGAGRVVGTLPSLAGFDPIGPDTFSRLGL